MATATTRTLLPTGTWSVDAARSRVEFEAKQLGIATVRGGFTTFEGTLELGDDLAGARAYGSVSMASLDTRHERRDAHLRSPAFLDAERFPRLTFESTEIHPLEAGTLAIAGNLTLHGVTRPITLTAEVRHSDERLALAITGGLSRSHYGMTSFKGLVSDKIELRLEVSAVKEA